MINRKEYIKYVSGYQMRYRHAHSTENSRENKTPARGEFTATRNNYIPDISNLNHPTNYYSQRNQKVLKKKNR